MDLLVIRDSYFNLLTSFTGCDYARSTISDDTNPYDRIISYYIHSTLNVAKHLQRKNEVGRIKKHSNISIIFAWIFDVTSNAT